MYSNRLIEGQQMSHRWTWMAALALIVVQLTGCAQQKVTETEQYAQRSTGMDEPLVLPGSPAAPLDRGAHLDSERELDGAHWEALEQRGPKPILGGGRRDSRASDSDSTSSRANSEDPTNPQYLQATGEQPPTTQPATQPAVISGRAIPTGEVIHEEDLPVTVVELPDGRLRMIWQLRSYGGTNVTSARDGGTTRRNVTIAPPDLAPLVSVLTQHVGDNGTVVPLPRENTLVITCNADMRASMLDLLARLDIPPRQVEITAKIFEVSHDFDFQQGARVIMNRVAANDSQQAISIFDAQHRQGVTGTQQGSVIHLMRTFQNAGVDLDVSFQLLADAGMIRVVSSPRMTVAAGQTGYMLAGQELPIQSTTIVGNNINIATSYKPVGVQLYITPQAVGPDKIKLHAISVVSSVAGFSPLPTLSGGNSSQPTLINPIIDSREAETAVTIDDGHTLVISGLRMVRTITRENKVPGLGDLPVIGWLFKNHRSQQQMTDLYFFVTPTLL
jgi:type II secretory pathway component GspD/PulD (secretin)